jgi:methionine-S-sulfoxide reductase
MIKKAYLAGGCFWCVEHDMRTVEGVISVISGYMGGEDFVPSYHNHKGFRESILVEYDENKITYKKLLQFFIDHIDPTDTGGQFTDRGNSYLPAIYYTNEEEKKISQGVLDELNNSGVYDKPSAIEIIKEQKFFKAEEEHQDFAEKNPEYYMRYRVGSGREEFVQGTCKIREEKHINWSE